MKTRLQSALLTGKRKEMKKMIRKYVFGKPFETEAVVMEMENSEGMPEFGEIFL